MRHEIHYPSSSIRDFRAAEGLNGGQIGDPVTLVNVTETEYMYKYNGFEYQDELGLGWYDYMARNYDPAIGRWVVQDPIVHHSMSPYNSFDNNPVFWADPSGADAESRLKDIFNRSQDGDVWTADESGTLTNNRNGETSECDDCKANKGLLKGQVATRGSWGIGLLDQFTDAFSGMYNSYEFFVEGDNHFLLGPQLAGNINFDGIGIGLNVRNNMLEDSTQGNVGTVYRDELGLTFGLVSYQYLHRDTGAGPGTSEKTIETSHTIGIGPVQFGTKDGKPFIGTGVKFRNGFILGVVLGGSMGIRKK
ncbi:MAG TPA: RHS repeat-associated core domain-containing protein [Atopostipes sp.]|nr:RHS repeat-associated core domain-containing protein [Atopostipes sp.]